MLSTGVRMPRKVRQLESDLRRAGFAVDPDRGKGSHGWWMHPTGVRVTLAGRSGADAKDYQEQDVRDAIRQAKARAREQ